MAAASIRLFNTMTMQKEPLEPAVPGKLGVYVCGPTVYSYVHIGNARTFTSFDVVVRYLRYRGFEVKYVRNYTDVDDKINARARESGDEQRARHDLLAEKQPSLDFVTPTQLGAMALFLCSEAGDQVRGAAWNMDGGWAAR